MQASPQACNFIKKETLARVFSCQFCEIFNNTFSPEHHLAKLLETLFYRTLLDDCFLQMLSSEFWEVFKNNYFAEHLRTTASDFINFWFWGPTTKTNTFHDQSLFTGKHLLRELFQSNSDQKFLLIKGLPKQYLRLTKTI